LKTEFNNLKLRIIKMSPIIGIDLETKSETDYPFSSWDQLYECLGFVLESEFWSEKFPNYSSYLEKGGILKQVIEEMITEGCDVQLGLDGLVQCVIMNPRYALEYIDEMEDLVNLFYEKGATYTDVDFLLGLPDSGNEDSPYDMEEIAINYNVRGQMIDILAKHSMDVTGGLNWNDVAPIYWEEMVDSDGKVADGYKFMSFRNRCMMALKNHSEVLKNGDIHPHQIDLHDDNFDYE